jgi:hypothetical protein
VSSEHNPYTPPQAELGEVSAPPALAAGLDGPEGIGGWLILPLLGLIFTPIRVAMGSVQVYSQVFQPGSGPR